jgi:hypothetical protein
MSTLEMSWTGFGRTTSAVECIVDEQDSNSTLLKIDLSNCDLGEDGVSILAQTLGFRNNTLQKLALNNESITSAGVWVLLETMEQNSYHITDLELKEYSIGTEVAS